MIIKHNNNLYNLDGWKKVRLEDGYCIITLPDTIKVDDDYYEPYEISLELVDEEYLYAFQINHKDYDHKDLRQVRYRADDIIYQTILNEIKDKQEYIDLDKLIDMEKVLDIANKDYEREWKEDADNYSN